jgi:hypothetical protein
MSDVWFFILRYMLIIILGRLTECLREVVSCESGFVRPSILEKMHCVCVGPLAEMIGRSLTRLLCGYAIAF